MKFILSTFVALAFSSLALAASDKATTTKTTTTKTTTKTVQGGQPQVYFENLKDGDKVKSPFTVKMGLKGLKLRDAGQDPEDKTTGHHHLLVNRGFIPEGQPIPTDETHLHYGKSQTEAQVTLAPGQYTLTLQLADGAHRSYGEKLSSSVKITVE